MTLATDILKQGLTVQIVPTQWNDLDDLAASVILPNVEYISLIGLEQMLQITKNYECDVIFRDNMIVYD